MVIDKPSNSDIEMLCWAVEISSTGMARPEPCVFFVAVMVTSLICVASCSRTTKCFLFSGSNTVFAPT